MTKQASFQASRMDPPKICERQVKCVAFWLRKHLTLKTFFSLVQVVYFCF